MPSTRSTRHDGAQVLLQKVRAKLEACKDIQDCSRINRDHNPGDPGRISDKCVSVLFKRIKEKYAREKQAFSLSAIAALDSTLSRDIVHHILHGLIPTMESQIIPTDHTQRMKCMQQVHAADLERHVKQLHDPRPGGAAQQGDPALAAGRIQKAIETYSALTDTPYGDVVKKISPQARRPLRTTASLDDAAKTFITTMYHSDNYRRLHCALQMLARALGCKDGEEDIVLQARTWDVTADDDVRIDETVAEIEALDDDEDDHHLLFAGMDIAAYSESGAKYVSSLHRGGRSESPRPSGLGLFVMIGELVQSSLDVFRVMKSKLDPSWKHQFDPFAFHFTFQFKGQRHDRMFSQWLSTLESYARASSKLQASYKGIVAALGRGALPERMKQKLLARLDRFEAQVEAHAAAEKEAFDTLGFTPALTKVEKEREVRAAVPAFHAYIYARKCAIDLELELRALWKSLQQQQMGGGGADGGNCVHVLGRRRRLVYQGRKQCVRFNNAVASHSRPRSGWTL